jgi:hypothetical protein
MGGRFGSADPAQPQRCDDTDRRRQGLRRTGASNSFIATGVDTLLGALSPARSKLGVWSKSPAHVAELM